MLIHEFVLVEMSSVYLSGVTVHISAHDTASVLCSYYLFSELCQSHPQPIVQLLTASRAIEALLKPHSVSTADMTPAVRNWGLVLQLSL